MKKTTYKIRIWYRLKAFSKSALNTVVNWSNFPLRRLIRAPRMVLTSLISALRMILTFLISAPRVGIDVLDLCTDVLDFCTDALYPSIHPLRDAVNPLLRCLAQLRHVWVKSVDLRLNRCTIVKGVVVVTERTCRAVDDFEIEAEWCILCVISKDGFEAHIMKRAYLWS